MWTDKMSLEEVDSESRLLCGGPVLGVTSSTVPGELVVSRRNGQIQVLNMVRQCCVSSWQLSSSQTLTCPVVQHSLSYWAVTDNKNVLTWQSSDTSLTQLDQGLPTAAHSLVVARGNNVPLAVLNDGRVCVLGQPQEKCKIKANMIVQFADVFQSGTEEFVCVVTCVRGDVSVSVWRVLSGGVEMVTSVMTEPKQLTSFCSCQNQLITCDCDGQFYSYPLDQLTTATSIINLVPRATVGQRPIRLQLATVSTEYFVSYDDTSLLLWEPVYMTKQCIMNMDQSKMFACDGWVCGTGEAVRVWRVEGGCGGLASALGKTSPTHLSSVTSWDNKLPCDTEDIIDKLEDKDKTPTLESLMSVLSVNPDLCYSGVIQRLLKESDFWASEALAKLIRARVVPSSLSDQLLNGCTQHNDWDLMVHCLESCSGFSEHTIVDVVQTVLSLPQELNCSQTIIQRDSLISLLLNQPFNDALLQQPLSQMKHTTVIALLKFIVDHVGVASLLAPPTTHYNSLLDWAGQVVDVHFAQLTLDPCAREILVRLQSLVRDQVTCWNRLSVLRGVGGASSAIGNQPTTNGWLYRVETMDINI